MDEQFRWAIWWTGFNGSYTRVETAPHPTAREARKDAIRMARALGWRPQRWWQWWRRHDTKVSLDFSGAQS